jgi:hypothetical protein
VIDFEPVRYGGPNERKSPTIRPLDTPGKQRDYSRQPRVDYNDAAAKLTDRQANFCRNLIGLSLASGSSRIPVDFEDAEGKRWYLDHGCIKIAAHAGFIRPLRNGPSNVLEEIELAWRTDGTSVLNR